jgi:hypothetical protein
MLIDTVTLEQISLLALHSLFLCQSLFRQWSMFIYHSPWYTSIINLIILQIITNSVLKCSFTSVTAYGRIYIREDKTNKKSLEELTTYPSLRMLHSAYWDWHICKLIVIKLLHRFCGNCNQVPTHILSSPYKITGKVIVFQDFSLLHSVQTGTGAHIASCAMGTIFSFPGAKAAGM